MDISELLAFTVKQGASDLHISAGLPPMIRVDGELRRINLPALDSKQARDLLYETMNDNHKKVYENELDVDFSFEIPGMSRFRANVFHQNRGAAGVFRVVPNLIKRLDELDAPPVFKTIATKPRGLVLVTGPVGSGKSTTLAAMINYINEEYGGHVITVEDPIEFVHESKRCLVNQREILRDATSFGTALRAALREDPNVLLVGEMRDLETIRLALTAAETGTLVLATLHTVSAAKSVDRIVGVFDSGEKELIRNMLSESIQAVITQTLLKKTGGGRVAAHEIMVATPAIRNLIREGKVAQMYSMIQAGQQYGMRTLDQSLKQLVREGKIDAKVAQAKAAYELEGLVPMSGVG